MNTETDSHFNMWRCVVAVAHADNKIHQDEKIYLQKIFQNIPFSEEQRETLARELDTPHEIDGLLGAVDVPADRSKLVYFARILCWADGSLHPEEKEIIQHLHSNAMDQVELHTIIDKINQIKSEKEAELQKAGSGGVFERFFRAIGLDLI